MASVWGDGVDELNRVAFDLGKAAANATGRAAIAVGKTAAAVEVDAKAFCPVDTGNLRNSIGHDTSLSGLAAEIGPTASYGAYVEFGTARMAPEAYMGPALDRQSPAFIDALEQAAGIDL